MKLKTRMALEPKLGKTFEGTVSNIKNIGKNFAAGIVKAAEEANVPK